MQVIRLFAFYLEIWHVQISNDWAVAFNRESAGSFVGHSVGHFICSDVLIKQNKMHILLRITPNAAKMIFPSKLQFFEYNQNYNWLYLSVIIGVFFSRLIKTLTWIRVFESYTKFIKPRCIYRYTKLFDQIPLNSQRKTDFLIKPL